MNNNQIARELIKVAKMIDSTSLTTYRNYGLRMDDTDLSRLTNRLKEIAGLGTNTEAAKNRWITTNDHGGEGISDRWEKDKKLFMIATGFFLDRQKYLPTKVQTIDKRLDKFGPIRLFETFSGEDKKWLKGIVSLAKGFIGSIKKWVKAEKSGDVPNEFKFGPFTVKNFAALTKDELKPFLDVIKKGMSKVPDMYTHGELWITTKKELGRGNTVAYYMTSKDAIAILTDVNDPELVYSFVHEIGHRAEKLRLSVSEELNEIYEEVGGSEVDQRTIFKLVRGIFVGSLNKKIMKSLSGNKEVLARINTLLQNVDSFYGKKAKELIEDVGNGEIGKSVSIQVVMKALASSIKSILQGGRIDSKMQKFLQMFPEEELMKWLKDLANEHLRTFKLHDVVDDIYDAVGGKVGDIFPTNYSKTDFAEFFAEVFAHYAFGKPLNPKVEQAIKGAF